MTCSVQCIISLFYCVFVLSPDPAPFTSYSI